MTKKSNGVPPTDLHQVAADLRLAVFKLARRLRAERVIDAIGDTQFAVLSYLRKNGPCPVGVLAEWEHVSAPAMTNTVNALESAGYVRRIDDPSDRRLVLAQVTDSGVRVVDETKRRRTEWLEAALAAVGEKDRRALLRVAEIMVEVARR